MLASSPNTIAETELALEHPAPPEPGGRFRRPRSQRLGFGAWAAIGWLLFVLALSLVTVFATTAIDKSGNQSPPSSGRRMVVLIFALGVVSIPILARITRANALQWSQREFVMAARAQGATNLRTMVREVLPNVLPAMFSIALLGIAVVIVAEGGLSILGVGVLSPAVSWGSMIAISRADLQTLPYEVLEPIVFIFFTVLSLNFLGDVVRARFDVRESAI